MKLFLGSPQGFPPHKRRIYAELDGRLMDLKLAYATYLTQVQGDDAGVYELAGYYFPATLAAFLERGEPARKAANDALAFARARGARALSGPGGEKIVHDQKEVTVVTPFKNPEKSFVIGFADKARAEAMPKAEIPTGFYKLPQTFITQGAPIVWPKFSTEVDADACLAIIIGKAGKRIGAAQAWSHVAGVTLLIDITARDVNRREGLTTNNLLGKNFPSSTCLGPGVLIDASRDIIETLEVELWLDGTLRQKFSLHESLFTLEQIIERWSIIGLKPGDFLAIGASMARKGDRMQSPVPLKVGSHIRVAAPALGELSHQIISPGGPER